MNQLITKSNFYAQCIYYIGGNYYRWSGWLGCQLESYEWFRVPAGTQRDLVLDYETKVTVTVYTTKRVGLKIRTTWTVSQCGTFDERVQRVKDLHAVLKNLH